MNSYHLPVIAMLLWSTGSPCAPAQDDGQRPGGAANAQGQPAVPRERPDSASRPHRSGGPAPTRGRVTTKEEIRADVPVSFPADI